MLEKSKEFFPNDVSEAIENGQLQDHFNYPSIGRLFSGEDPDRLDELRQQYIHAKSELDTVIRRGSREEADKASRAVKAITVTLEFLESLERQNDS
ncbi:MAG: hypothetical protein OEQ28_15495 [Acidobacteriota bacterium]|nr:hypothetical protein [Acidobacteriota bacterium]